MSSLVKFATKEVTDYDCAKALLTILTEASQPTNLHTNSYNPRTRYSYCTGELQPPHSTLTPPLRRPDLASSFAPRIGLLTHLGCRDGRSAARYMHLHPPTPLHRRRDHKNPFAISVVRHACTRNFQDLHSARRRSHAEDLGRDRGRLVTTFHATTPTPALTTTSGEVACRAGVGLR